MSSEKDYYKVLGVPRTASQEEIRTTFRRLALEYHPDRNKSQDAQAKFKEVNAAYQVLSDPEKRAQYDRYGRVGGSSESGYGRGFHGADSFGGFGDIFDAFFGGSGGGARSSARPGRDIRSRVTLSFEEAVFGVNKTLDINRVEQCNNCSGNGAEPGSKVNTCGTCNGNGQVRRTQRSLFGQFAQVTGCPTCSGKGTVIESSCRTCRGNGVERRSRTTEVSIPAGIQSGMQIRITGQGNVGRNNGPNGNLYLEVDVLGHDVFTRQESDLFYKLTLSMTDAALGVELEVPTLEGQPEKLKVPQGTQPGEEFRVKGKGVPHINSNRRGDLRIIANLDIPKNLTKDQRKLLQELDRSFKHGNK